MTTGRINQVCIFCIFGNHCVVSSLLCFVMLPLDGLMHEKHNQSHITMHCNVSLLWYLIVWCMELDKRSKCNLIVMCNDHGWWNGELKECMYVVHQLMHYMYACTFSFFTISIMHKSIVLQYGEGPTHKGREDPPKGEKRGWMIVVESIDEDRHHTIRGV